MNKINSIVFLIMFQFVTGQSHANDEVHESALLFFKVLPKSMPGSATDTKQQIAIGKKLYFETALSVNNTQSCNSCHNIINNEPGVDHLRISVGALGKLGTRNAGSTWNAGMHVAQFWDGRAKTLEQQVKFPLFNPIEMAMPSAQEVILRLNNKDYLSYFEQAFPTDNSPINLKNISKSLAAFQRTLITNDRLDEYLLGNKKAITSQEKNGLTVFIQEGCVACHNGPLLGGQLFMKMGIVHPYPNKVDKGIGSLTGNAGDNYFFKVPSLRNVLNTAPYFHDGAALTIEEAIKDTGWHQLGITLNEHEIKSIKTFFGTLNNNAKIIESN